MGKDDKDLWRDPPKAKEVAKAAPKAVTEVPGMETSTHGGSGAPPSVDPDVQALIDSGKELEVGGDNILREVKPDNS